jgi:tetratricopeptide (TPR) repeat protein
MAAQRDDPGDDPGLSAELAYRGLPADTARTFRLLSVHPGSDAGTAAVAALADLTFSEAQRTLLSLESAGLVGAVSVGGDRWRVHAPARAYVARLPEARAATDWRERARDRLLRYFQIATEAADGMLRGLPSIPGPHEFTDRAGALAWLDAERESVLAVTRMAAEVGQDHAAKNLPLLMAYYLDFRGGFDDLLAATAIGLEAARRLGDRAAEGEALNNLGGALIGLGRYDEALTRYQDAVAVFGQARNPRAKAESSANLAVALTGLGRYDEALTTYHDALAILRMAGDQQVAGAALNNLGTALGTAQRYDEARAVYQDAIAIFRDTGDRHRLAMTLGNLGNVLRSLERPADAVSSYQEAVAIFRETGDRAREEAALKSLTAVDGAP